MTAGPSSPPGSDASHPRGLQAFIEARRTIFVLELFYLSALLTAAATYVEGIYALPGSIGTLPLAVPWFGAVGAVLVSLAGSVSHARDWNPNTAYWHISRPLVGATVAIVGVLIMQAGLTAVGSGPNSSGAVSTPSAPHNVLYYVVAFALGYRESMFRQLLARVIDVILTPGSGASGPGTPGPGTSGPGTPVSGQAPPKPPV